MTRHATARLFVALDLPVEVRAQLAGWARRCAPGGVLRLLDPETLHVTLCFLGERPVGEINAIGEGLARACAEADALGPLALGAPLWLPPRRPRALAVELHDDADGALHALHEAILRELTAVCELEPDPAAGGRGGGRRFRPHVTVARLRASDAPHQRVLPATPALAFAAGAVTLQRSRLSPSGAGYECLSSHALAAQP